MSDEFIMQTNKNLLPKQFVKKFVSIASCLKESIILFKGNKISKISTHI